MNIKNENLTEFAYRSQQHIHCRICRCTQPLKKKNPGEGRNKHGIIFKGDDFQYQFIYFININWQRQPLPEDW
jgi:hypothetical protein